MTHTIPPIFKDKLLQQKFDEDGFLKITLLSKEDVEQLLALYRQYFPNPSANFFSSSHVDDYKFKKEISDGIGRIMVPNLEKIFTNYTWFGSAFLTKGDGPKSELPMHQDWTIVDETKFVALNIWTPLQNTTEENGTLEVIKGSHKWHDTYRAPTLPFYFDGYQHQLKKQLTAIPTDATEAIVLNQAIVHYSKPNKTKDIRVAMATGIKTLGAPMVFNYWDKEKPDQIEQFRQEEDFLIRFTDFHQSIYKRPVIGKSIGFKPFGNSKASQKEIDTILGVQTTNHAGTKKGIGQKLLEWIRN